MKLLLLVAGVLFASAPLAGVENVYSVPLSDKTEWLGPIELPATITGRVASASSYHAISFQTRATYSQMKAAIYVNTGTNMTFSAVLRGGEGDDGWEVPLPYGNLTFSAAATYLLVVSEAPNSVYNEGASYAVRLGSPDAVDSTRVAFDGNGGNASTNEMSYVLGGKYDKFPSATRIGYDFTGWGTAATNGVTLSTNTQVCVGYTTLYAQWQVDPTYPVVPTNEPPVVTNYYVRFDANGGTGVMSNQTFSVDVQQALSTNAFTRGGYEFRGWATSPTGSVVYVDRAVVSNLTAAGATFNLYANWMISSALISSANVDGVTWYYTATNGGATIQNVSGGVPAPAVDASGKKDLVVPAVLGTNAVVKIGDWALSGCSSVTNIVIPLGVEAIGNCAFAGCTSLSPGITIPESVTSLGAFVFTNCPNLKIVRYLGNCPDADEELYAGAPSSLISGVLPVRSGWALEDGTSATDDEGGEEDDDDDEGGSLGGGGLPNGQKGCMHGVFYGGLRSPCTVSCSGVCRA